MQSPCVAYINYQVHTNPVMMASIDKFLIDDCGMNFQELSINYSLQAGQDTRIQN